MRDAPHHCPFKICTAKSKKKYARGVAYGEGNIRADVLAFGSKKASDCKAFRDRF